MREKMIKRNIVRRRRTLRVRKRLKGCEGKPRLSVVKTNKHILVQLIDDVNGKTLASTSTLSKEYKQTEYNKKNKTSAKQLGLKIGNLAKDQGITGVVFDRGRFKYHGVIAAVAEGAREQGLQF
ncbi:MAG: 50S ribosomal protein L18 [Chlamydiia bacterium]|nr:50S ribosomal protein L18 [Chlamydiia bacterium]